MGVKRHFEEEFPEVSFKQAKHPDNKYSLTSISNDFPSRESSPKADARGEDDNNFWNRLDIGDIHGPSNIMGKELETSMPLSWVTSSGSEEDSVFDDTFCWSFPGYFDFSIPRPSPVLREDAYSYVFDSSPRKGVPVGPDYQADIPHWNTTSIRCYDEGVEQKLMGTCIIPMPSLDTLTFGGDAGGQGPTTCGCTDVGSVRCVQKHVKEARDKLREAVGDEIFVKLGFCDMGEEVAYKWTEKDEQLFHEVIYSNPVSLGGNFWKVLKFVFPNRSQKELVSFYFNVFMLRKRASQNRSSYLDVDSDDDEWHGAVEGVYPVVEKDEDLTVESFGDVDNHVAHEDDFSSESSHEDVHEYSNNGFFYEDGDSGNGQSTAVEVEDRIVQMSRQEAEKSHVDFPSYSDLNCHSPTL